VSVGEQGIDGGHRPGRHDALVDADEGEIDAEIPLTPSGRVRTVADSIGTFHDTAGLAGWLGVSPRTLLRRVARRQVVACKTTDRHWVYPAWQFTDDGDVVGGLLAIWEILLREVDAWVAALWLATPSPDLPGDVSAVEWLTYGQDPAPVLLEARRDVARWAH